MATKEKAERFKFSAVLMVAGMPTVPNGEIYSMQIMNRIVERCTLKPSLIVQEMNPVERKAKNIPLAEPWDKKIMADIVSAQIMGTRLVINCECRNNRDGKKLQGLLQTVGIDALEFFPVGYGIQGADGVINPDYKLNYVAIEPKAMQHRKR